MPQLIGPFRQIITLQQLPLKGPLRDDQLQIIENGGIVVEDGKILEVGPMAEFGRSGYTFSPIEQDMILLPGLIDCHTHLVWGGNRARDYTMRMAGRSYQDILARGGGIFDSVAKTQASTKTELVNSLVSRVNRHLRDGVTTIEVKTGYGLLKEQELKILEAIRESLTEVNADLVSTCLAAHVCPKEFEKKTFLEYLENELLPQILVRGLARRVDIFIEHNAFPREIARKYLAAAKKLGFELTIHADQFTTGGSQLAVELNALSADHLEASGEKEIDLLAKSNVVAVALPGASIGLGMQFTPARKLLDRGASLAIATDWNPGSAPMGDLLILASILGIYEKLSSAELLAGMTFRAAAALGQKNRGIIAPGYLADMIAFELSDYREIFYNQGKIKPKVIWKSGNLI